MGIRRCKPDFKASWSLKERESKRKHTSGAPSITEEISLAASSISKV